LGAPFRSLQTVFQRITEGRLSFPSYMSQACVDIIRKLLDPNPETRLGCGKNGAKDIKDHPFFAKEINFNLLIRMKEEAPVSVNAFSH
jgi:serum/glucocorticoid-regulated kinase 2